MIGNAKIKVEFQYFKSENEARPKSFYSNDYFIKGEQIDLKNESIKIEKIDLKGLIKIFLQTNYKKIESDEGLPNFFLLVLEEIKSLKDFQEFTWNIVNNIKLKLKLKINLENKTNIQNIKLKKKEIDKEKNIIKPNSYFNNGAMNMKDKLKIFNNNNKNTNNFPLKSEPNIKKDAPKKLIINPNLYDKEGKIRIITSKDKIKIPKKENYNTNKEVKTKENNNLKEFLYGNQKEKSDKEKIVVKKRKGTDIPIKSSVKNDINMNNYLSENYSKRKSQVKPSSARTLINSIKNPKSQYEQEEEKEKNEEKISFKEKKASLGDKIKKNFSNFVDNFSSRTKKPEILEKENLNTETEGNEIKSKEKLEEKTKSLTENKILNYKNRNFSSDTRKIKKNFKDKYNISENINKEENKRNEEYYKKEYVNIEPITYHQYLQKSKLTKHSIENETFCEGFFITSFPTEKGEVIENSESFPSPCGHKECSTFVAMKPEIIMRYPLNDTKNLELNNLAATICFPTGIKVCYSEQEPENMIDDYLTTITNQKGERYYMMTYHFYQKVNNNEYTKNYEMHPLKNHLMKFGDSYLTLSDEGFTEKIIKKVQETLEFCQELGFRDYVYIPFCLSIISRYPYPYEMSRSLQSILNVMSEEEIISFLRNDFKINDLIMYLVNSVPIPIEKNTRVKFYIPFFEEGITLKCPKIDEINLLNINYIRLLDLFSIENLIIIIRLLLFEKKILFIDDDYTRLSEVTDAFISLLYPFKWIHTYIPIMSDQMLKYLETFLPFLNGIHSSLMHLVADIFINGEVEDNDEVFLIYIKEGKIDLSSSLKKKKKKVSKYLLQSNVLDLPSSIEKKLKHKLSDIKDSYNNSNKTPLKRYSRATKPVDPSQYNKNIRNAFIEMFVEMFKEYTKYICLLDNDVVFNKNSFLNSIDKHDRKFYDEFIDTQLFQQFVQTIDSEEYDYFNKLINEEKSDFSGIQLDSKAEKVYIIPPSYLGTNEKDNDLIEKYVSQNYPTNLESNFIAKDEYKDLDGIIFPSHRIIPTVTQIEEEDYNNQNCLVYLLPNPKRISLKKSLTKSLRESGMSLIKSIRPKNVNSEEAQELGLRKTLTTVISGDEITEKEKDEIKEIIKDYLRKIFQSEDIDYKDPKVKTEILNILKRTIGREIFIKLLSSNMKKVTTLQINSFKFLAFLIYNVLVESLQIAETDKLLEEIYLLIKSTMYFGIEYKGRTKTLFYALKLKIRDFPKITQKNFWNVWFENEMKNHKDHGDSIKQSVILSICSKMVELEIIKIIIKDILDDLNKNSFGLNSEIGNQTQQMYMKKITDAKYTIKGKGKK